MSDPLYLCLDQGGHASRALVFDRRGVLQASALHEVGVREPQPGWVEQDPEELVASLQTVITKAVVALGARADQIICSGLATQRSSMVCWDRHTGKALSPIVNAQPAPENTRTVPYRTLLLKNRSAVR